MIPQRRWRARGRPSRRIAAMIAVALFMAPALLVRPADAAAPSDPVVTHVTPSSVPAGWTVELEVHGRFLGVEAGVGDPPTSGVWFAPPTVSFGGEGIEIVGPVAWLPDRLTVRVEVDDDASVGSRDVTVTNADGAFDTCHDCLTIT